MITTLDLPQEILTKAQGVAAARQTTLQALVVEGLQVVLNTSQLATSSTQAALSRLRTGFHMGGEKPLTRDETHAR
jgi:hypothetical protein